MAFFGYDPYGYDPCDFYYTAAPFNYVYDPYYQRQQPAVTRTRRSKPAAAKPAPRAKETNTSFEIPIHGPDSDPEPVQKRKAAPAMTPEEAAMKLQVAARGFLARKWVRAVRQVQREADHIEEKMEEAAMQAFLAGDHGARAAVSEALMKMVLRLDAVRGAREYRRRINRRVLALQDAVDALGTKPAPVEEAEIEVDAPEATAVETAEESAVPGDADRSGEMESIKTAVDTPNQVVVDEAIAAVVDEAIAAGEPEAEAVQRDNNADDDETGEWEMVTDEHTAPLAVATSDEPPRNELACLLETTATASAGAASSDSLDVSKVMEMVAALCEQNAKQCAVIGALAERVDALERTVRQMEDAESRRRQDKKQNAEGK